MLKVRVIPCLDVKDGRVVKGVNFVDLRDAGDPVECAIAYDAAGADELCFLDITASHENRSTLLDVVRRTAEACFMPLTVGGGVRTHRGHSQLLLAGADKVAINTAAVQRPRLRQGRRGKIRQPVHRRGDRRQNDEAGAAPRWEIFTHGGRRATGLDAVAFAREVVALGAGEILLTSMDRDGAKTGFDLALTARGRRRRRRAGDRLRRGRQSRPPCRRRPRRPGQRGARRLDLPFRRIHDPPGQAAHGGGRPSHAPRLAGGPASPQTMPRAIGVAVGRFLSYTLQSAAAN